MSVKFFLFYILHFKFYILQFSYAYPLRHPTLRPASPRKLFRFDEAEYRPDWRRRKPLSDSRSACTDNRPGSGSAEEIPPRCGFGLPGLRVRSRESDFVFPVGCAGACRALVDSLDRYADGLA